MPKLCEMDGVRGGETGFAVELWRDDDTGRLTVVGYNQAGYDGVGIDLWDLVGWLRSGAGSELLLEDGEGALAFGSNLGGHAPRD